jgi:hypothetical protein
MARGLHSPLSGRGDPTGPGPSPRPRYLGPPARIPPTGGAGEPTSGVDAGHPSADTVRHPVSSIGMFEPDTPTGTPPGFQTTPPAPAQLTPRERHRRRNRWWRRRHHWPPSPPNYLGPPVHPGPMGPPNRSSGGGFGPPTSEKAI